MGAATREGASVHPGRAVSQELVDGRFRIGQVIGRGNMGEVHRAEEPAAAPGPAAGAGMDVFSVHRATAPA